MNVLIKKRIKYAFLILILLFPVLIASGKFIKFGIYDAINFHPAADKIIAFMNNPIKKRIIDDSFYKAAMLYMPLYKLNLHSYIQFEYFFSIIFNFFLLYDFYRNREIINRSNIFQLLFLLLSVILLNVYVFGLGKEPTTFVAFIMIYVVLCHNCKNRIIKIGLTLSVLILMGLYIRTYYFLLIIFSSCFFLILNYKKNNKIATLLVMTAIFTIIYLIVLIILNKYMPQYYITMLKVATSEYELADSKIIPVFSDSNYLCVALNFFIKFFRLLIPIELLGMELKYIPYVFFQLIVTLYIVKNIINYKNLNLEEKIALSIFYGFILTSTSFEPDFGSWIRHEITCYPIMIIIMGLNYFSTSTPYKKKRLKITYRNRELFKI